jgi:hypothetical protein
VGQSQKLILYGEVVEIYEKGGLRLAKISVKPCNILAVAAQNIREAHLGDKVVIDASITVDQIRDEVAGEADAGFSLVPFIFNFEDFLNSERR